MDGTCMWITYVYTCAKANKTQKVFYEINRKIYPNLEVADREAETTLIEHQHELNVDPINTSLRDREREAAHKYLTVHTACMNFLSQKCKGLWLKAEDQNTAFFHRSLFMK